MEEKELERQQQTQRWLGDRKREEWGMQGACNKISHRVKSPVTVTVTREESVLYQRQQSCIQNALELLAARQPTERKVERSKLEKPSARMRKNS